MRACLTPWSSTPLLQLQASGSCPSPQPSFPPPPCPLCPGFQLFAEDQGGFGSVAWGLLEELKAEYSNKELLLFSLRPPTDPRIQLTGSMAAR